MLEIDYFNPVVDNWTTDCMEQEIKEKESCDFYLYTITPKMIGVYSVAELIDDLNKRPEKTLFIILKNDDSQKFTDAQMKSLKAVVKMVKRNGCQFFDNLESAAIWINKHDLTSKGDLNDA